MTGVLASLPSVAFAMSYERLDVDAVVDSSWTLKAEFPSMSDADDVVGDTSERFPSGFKYSSDGTRGLAYDAGRASFLVLDADAGGDGDVRYIASGERAYDWCFAPGRADAFASSSRDTPVTVRKTSDGTTVASYRSYNDADEIVAACGVSYVDGASKIACGLSGRVDVFDSERPGRDPAAVVQTKPTSDTLGQHGLISCVDQCPGDGNLFACGSYAKQGQLDCGVYDLRVNTCALSWSAGGSGVTQVKWSVDGNFLYVASRKSEYITCVDVRNTGQALYRLERSTSGTNQRVAFDIEPCGAHLVTGGADGQLRIFHLQKGEEKQKVPIAAQSMCVNSFAFHPYACASSEKLAPLGGARCAVTVGKRIFPGAVYSSDSDSETDSSSDSSSHSEEILNAFGVRLYNYSTSVVSYD